MLHWSSSFFFLLLAGLIVLVLFPHTSTQQMAASGLAGWHSRSQPYTADTFLPDRSALKLAVLRNAPAEPEGFTLALFDSPTLLAIDAAGRLLKLEDADFAGLVALAEQTQDLPSTGTFRNTWVIDQPVTSRPIDRILLPVAPGTGNDQGQQYWETSVQGFDGSNFRLRRPVGDIDELPPLLQDLERLVLEARQDSGERDDDRIDQVKSVLGDVF